MNCGFTLQNLIKNINAIGVSTKAKPPEGLTDLWYGIFVKTVYADIANNTRFTTNGSSFKDHPDRMDFSVNIEDGNLTEGHFITFTLTIVKRTGHSSFYATIEGFTDKDGKKPTYVWDEPDMPISHYLHTVSEDYNTLVNDKFGAEVTPETVKKIEVCLMKLRKTAAENNVKLFFDVNLYDSTSSLFILPSTTKIKAKDEVEDSETPYSLDATDHMAKFVDTGIELFDSGYDCLVNPAGNLK